MLREYRCSHCMTSYATSGTLSRHNKTIHQAFKPEGCPHCSARFRDKWSLKKHLPMHDEEHIAMRKNRALDWEGAEKAMQGGEESAAFKQEVQGKGRERGERQEEVEEGSLDMNPAEENSKLGAKMAIFEVTKLEFDLPQKAVRPQRFECYVCEERFDLFEFQTHVKGHTDDLRTTKDQLVSYMEKFSGSTEKMNATISSLISQEDLD